MMRFLGNTVAESFRGGMQQTRGFSSGMITASSSKWVDYGFKAAFCGAGYVIGGVTTTGAPRKVKEFEEMIIRSNENLDEHEAKLQEVMKAKLQELMKP